VERCFPPRDTALSLAHQPSAPENAKNRPCLGRKTGNLDYFHLYQICRPLVKKKSANYRMSRFPSANPLTARSLGAIARDRHRTSTIAICHFPHSQHPKTRPILSFIYHRPLQICFGFRYSSFVLFATGPAPRVTNMPFFGPSLLMSFLHFAL
jgi:hypothetical protein